MTLVSELVLTRNQLLQMFAQPGRQRIHGAIAAAVARHVGPARRRDEDSHAADRQRLVQAAPHRARPCRELGKKIDLQMIGAETELDRQVLELIKDPLTHMVRNSADHGLESPEDRRGRGQAEDRHDHAESLSRGRPHHHRDRRRRPRPRHRKDLSQGDRQRPGHRGRNRADDAISRFCSSSSAPASPPRKR